MTLAPVAESFREEVVAAAEAASAGAVRRNLRLAGRPVALDVADPALDAVLLPALADRVVTSGETPDARLVVWSRPRPDFPWGPQHLGRGGGVAGLSHGPVRASAGPDDRWLVLWDAERRLACCWFDGVDALRPWDHAAPLRAALHHALAGPGRGLVHGAVVGREGRGVLLAGPGGSGKSTTTLACLRAGLQVVGDDYSVVEVTGERARAWSLYRTLKVGERGAGRDERRTLLIGDDVAGITTEALDLVAVLVPEVRGGTSALQPLTPAAGLRALAPSTLLQAPYEDGPGLGPMADLVRRVSSYRLVLGADLGVPAVLEALAG